jgi:endonuclease/exonuclease/phosphatase (EEP) superfamily protein YafD
MEDERLVSVRNAFRPGRAGWIILALAVVSIGLPSLGHWFWIAELSTHFVVQYAVVALALAVGLACLNRPVVAATALVVCIVQIARLGPLWAQPDRPAVTGAPERLTIAQVNVHVNHSDPRRVVEWVLAQSPDVAVLIEVTPEWSEPLALLRARYTQSLVRIPPDGSGVAVFARRAESSLRVEALGDAWCPAIVLNVGQPAGPPVLTLFATHLRSPTTPGDAWARNRQLTELGRRVAEEPAVNKAVVGDLNVTRWSPWFSELVRIAGVRDGQEGFGLGGSWPSGLGRWFALPIDHTLVSPGVRVVRREVGPDLGSDHRPVTTTIEFSHGAGVRADDRDFSA